MFIFVIIYFLFIIWTFILFYLFFQKKIKIKNNNKCPNNKKEIYNDNSNMTSFFRFANKRASYPFGIISLAHAPVNVTDFSIGSIKCVRHFPQT